MHSSEVHIALFIYFFFTLGYGKCTNKLLKSKFSLFLNVQS